MRTLHGRWSVKLCGVSIPGFEAVANAVAPCVIELHGSRACHPGVITADDQPRGGADLHPDRMVTSRPRPASGDASGGRRIVGLSRRLARVVARDEGAAP